MYLSYINQEVYTNIETVSNEDVFAGNHKFSSGNNPYFKFKGEEPMRDAVFDPDMADSKRLKLLNGWKKAVGRSLDWEEHK